MKPGKRPSPHRTEGPRGKAKKVREELKVAGAELHLTNTALKRCIPEQAQKGDVKKALAHNDVVEQKITQASKDLAEMAGMLERDDDNDKA